MSEKQEKQEKQATSFEKEKKARKGKLEETSKNSEDKVEALRKELKEREVQLNDLTETLQRLQAEFENFKKRNEKENKNFQEFANASLISDFLPFLDSLENALQTIKKAESFPKEKAVEGTQKLFEQFQSLLQEKGLQEIKAVGKKFDPQFHECLMQENQVEKEDGVVLEELQKGYLFKGKVLRPAKVKINRIEKAEKKE